MFLLMVLQQEMKTQLLSVLVMFNTEPFPALNTFTTLAL